MACPRCNGVSVEAGFQKNGVQKFLCKGCNRYHQNVYKNLAYKSECNNRIVSLLTEGMALRGIARVLGIALKTVISRIRKIARLVAKPFSLRANRIFEVDELWSFVGKKDDEVWITYSLDRASKCVTEFNVGGRTKGCLEKVTAPLVVNNPRHICTDGLNSYRSLIPESIHRVGLPHTRRIERFNLNLRTHLKRLARKTICFSRSREMLEACLKIYFWGRPTT